MKIAIDKVTKKIIGFADVDDVDLSYLKNCDIKVVKDKMPDRIEACKWDGKKIIVDENLKTEAIIKEEKQKIINDKKAEILVEREAQKEKELQQQEAEIEEQAIQRAIDEGLLGASGELKPKKEVI